MNIFKSLSIVPLSGDGDCQVTVEPSGDPEADRRSYRMADQLCQNLTTDHSSADLNWHNH
jgi:hypothetical protein